MRNTDGFRRGELARQSKCEMVKVVKIGKVIANRKTILSKVTAKQETLKKDAPQPNVRKALKPVWCYPLDGRPGGRAPRIIRFPRNPLDFEGIYV